MLLFAASATVRITNEQEFVRDKVTLSVAALRKLVCILSSVHLCPSCTQVCVCVCYVCVSHAPLPQVAQTQFTSFIPCCTSACFFSKVSVANSLGHSKH